MALVAVQAPLLPPKDALLRACSMPVIVAGAVLSLLRCGRGCESRATWRYSLSTARGGGRQLAQPEYGATGYSTAPKRGFGWGQIGGRGATPSSARQKGERTRSALIAAALHSAPAELPADFCRQVCRVREAGWWLVRARNTTTNNSTTAHGSTRSALLALLCGFSPTLLLPRRPIRRSYALHRPASFCTAVRCYKLAAAQLYCGAYNKAVGCPEARLSHPRIQRSYALYPPGVCDRLGCILPLPPSETRTFASEVRF